MTGLQTVRTERQSHSQPHSRKAPLISVIIPTYNCAKYLPSAIQSVLEQTFLDFEIIVVDDGSDDHTSQVIKRFGDKVHYVSQAHKGNAAARNRGIKEGKGQWLCFLDADDLWESRKLELQLNDMLSHPGLKVNFPGGVRFYQSGETQVMHAGPDDETQLWPWLVKFQPFGSSLSGVMIHRSCFEEVGGYDENLKLSVDWDMWIRLASRYQLRWFSEVLVHVRVHPEGANRNAELRLNMYLSCLRKHQKFFCIERGMRKPWCESYGSRLQHLGRHLLKNGRYHQAAPYLVKCIRFGGQSNLREKLSLLLECQLRKSGMGFLVNLLNKLKSS